MREKTITNMSLKNKVCAVSINQVVAADFFQKGMLAHSPQSSQIWPASHGGVWTRESNPGTSPFPPTMAVFPPQNSGKWEWEERTLGPGTRRQEGCLGSIWEEIRGLGEW